MSKDAIATNKSILIHSWAAEEAGIMGSAEWVYDKVHKVSCQSTHIFQYWRFFFDGFLQLMSRAVGVINIDAPIQGPILLAYASPALTGVFLKAIQGIPSTADQSQSYYQFLEDFYQRDNSTKEKSVRENINILGSGKV